MVVGQLIPRRKVTDERKYTREELFGESTDIEDRTNKPDAGKGRNQECGSERKLDQVENALNKVC